MSVPKSRQHSPDFETLGVLATFFLILNLITHRQLFVYVALALMLVALFVKPLARSISLAWLKFAEVIGTFNSKLILSLVFFLFLTPLALLYRIFNKNPLSIKPGLKSDSLFVIRDHVYSKADFEKMW
jgi:mannose/fructose/N-acetylgalactosamine-specific phosphotransferase system component IIC